MNMYEKIIEPLDIQSGDIVMVSSDVRKLVFQCMRQKQEFDMNAFIDAFIARIGSDGTLLFPVYNWDFCNGIAFDYKNTVGKTGSLGNAALKRADFKRTKHPLYSFAVWGKDQKILCEKEYSSSFGEESIFAYLHDVNAKNAVFDVEIAKCCTFAHFVEETSGLVNYRYKKSFTAPYIDENGQEQERTYEMFVRDLELDVKNVGPSEKDFLTEGVGQSVDVEGHHWFVFSFVDAYQMIDNDIKHNKSRKICRYKGQ